MNSQNHLTPAPFATHLARRICIIKTSSLGDIVQALPVLSAIRWRYPNAHISWVANSSYLNLLEPISQLDETIPFDRDCFRRDGWSSWRKMRQFFREMRQRRYDLTIDLQGLFRSGMICRATRAEHRVGLASAREGARWFYTDVVNDCVPGQVSAVERYWKVAELVGAGHLRKQFPISLSDAERQWARAQLANLRRPLVAVNAGARWPTKRWPAARFAEAAWNALGTQAGSLVVLGGPDDGSVAAEVERQWRAFASSSPTRDDGDDCRNLCGRMTLRHLAAVLADCDMLLTNDSGPMHLAAAVDTPTISIFTCTSPQRAAAYGESHQWVQANVPCRSSYLKQCPSMVCMDELTTQRILPVLRKCVAEYPGLQTTSSPNEPIPPNGNRAA